MIYKTPGFVELSNPRWRLQLFHPSLWRMGLWRSHSDEYGFTWACPFFSVQYRQRRRRVR